MNSLHNLPQGLLVLLLTLPTLSLASGFVGFNNTTKSNTTSPSDPFRTLRLRANTKPSDPICCLTPLTPEPLPTTAEFLSFEEWKSKQRELQAQAQAANQTPSPDVPAPEAPAGAPAVPSTTITGDLDIPVPVLVDSTPSFSPHFRVPLTDRFNYASLDCSARIHTSHRSARSPSAILSSKKDKYMLSPCSADPHFVVVELCDDIRIDTVQLANFEFFSGVFREFKVSVAQTYPSDDQGWIVAGVYQAKNIRGVQSFHPLVELRPFYRYIRIDFLSHYGSEFYCPVSLLRVYGLTQMEEWQWEVWQSGSDNPVAQALPKIEVAPKIHDIAETENANGTAATETKLDDHFAAEPEEPSDVMHPQTAPNMSYSGPHDSNKTLLPETQSNALLSSQQQAVLETPTTHISSPQRTVTHGTVADTHIPAKPISPAPGSVEPPVNSSSSTNASLSQANVTGTAISSSIFHSASSSSGSSVQILVSLPSSSPAPSGESIYRTIMNRLGMLETNTTLYQKYVEEQTLQIREALRRLEEDVGRLEGISKSQQQVFFKTMQELDLRRRQMDEERWELLKKVNHLADEVTLEKRLGIAQLCLLLTVLVFMALTRGSRVAFLDGTMHRLNSFSRHRKWSSADWPRKRWLSRSRTPTPMDYAKKEPKEESREVTITSAVRSEDPKSSLIPFPTTPPARSQTPRSPARRPTTPRRQDMPRVSSETRPTGRLRRSNSHTTPASAMLSAKRFARTAHLHEVPQPVKVREAADGDVSNSERGPLVLGDGSPKPRRRVKEPSTMRAPKSPPRRSGGEESDAGSWVDTESGMDSDPDSDGAESEERPTQVLQKPEFDFGNDRSVPVISAPPSRRREFKGHSPPSPASVVG